LLFGGMMAKPWLVPPDAAVEAFANLARSPAFDATLEILGRYTYSRGGEVRVPVTIVWGNRDFLLIPRQGPRAARVIPTARLVRLPSAGHVPTYDAPDELARILLAA
jgi:pimeloyl-ACP methyl ester carboxylesterase